MALIIWWPKATQGDVQCGSGNIQVELLVKTLKWCMCTLIKCGIGNLMTQGVHVLLYAVMFLVWIGFTSMHTGYFIKKIEWRHHQPLLLYYVVRQKIIYLEGMYCESTFFDFKKQVPLLIF